jgi:hypothetical protein
MSDKTIQAQLRDVRQQLAEALKQRDQLSVTILELQSQANALSAILTRDRLVSSTQKPEQGSIGLTEMIRTVMRLSAQPMTPAQIKNTLTVMGFNFSGFSNSAAVVHSTLKRMESSGELVYMESKGYRLRNVLY